MAVDARRFVLIWNSAGSLAEVADKAGITQESASTRAHRYRKRGVPLSKFPRGRKPLEAIFENDLDFDDYRA